MHYVTHTSILTEQNHIRTEANPVECVVLSVLVDWVIWRVTMDCIVRVNMVLAWCFGGVPMGLRVLVFQWAPWFTKHMNICVCDKRLCGIGKYYMLGSFECCTY